MTFLAFPQRPCLIQCHLLKGSPSLLLSNPCRLHFLHDTHHPECTCLSSFPILEGNLWELTHCCIPTAQDTAWHVSGVQSIAVEWMKESLMRVVSPIWGNTLLYSNNKLLISNVFIVHTWVMTVSQQQKVLDPCCSPLSLTCGLHWTG